MEVRCEQTPALSVAPPLAQRTPPPGLGSAVGLIAGYFALQLLAGFTFALIIKFATSFKHPVHEMEAAIDGALSQANMQAWLAIFSLGVAAPLILWLAHRHWLPWWSVAQPPGLGFTLPTRASLFALAAMVGLLAPWLGSLLTQWLADGHPVIQDIQLIGAQTPLLPRVLLALAVVCLGPVVEELLFRGVLLSTLLRRWNAATAIVASSLVFALIHLPGMDYQWYALPNLLLLAVLLAALRLYSKSIWPGVLAHGINNLVAVAAWFIAVRPTG